MSNNGFIFFKDYVKYLLDKHNNRTKIFKKYHNIKLLDIDKFLEKINNNLQIDDDDYYYSSILLYKLSKKKFKLNYLNMKEYTIGCILLSQKFNDDFAHDNIDWASILKYRLKYINRIEKNLLDFLEFKIYISENKFNYYVNIIEIKLRKQSRFKKVLNNLTNRFSLNKLQ